MIKKNMKTHNTTTVEQSRKFIELGIDPNTADMWYQEISFGIYKLQVEKPRPLYGLEPKGIPAWSLSSLLELLPDSIDENTDSFSSLKLIKRGVAYYYQLGDKALRKGFLSGNLKEASFEMICWLKEKAFI